MKHDLSDYIEAQLDLIVDNTKYDSDLSKARKEDAVHPQAWALGYAQGRLESIKRAVDTIRRRAQERRVSPETEFITAHDLLGFLDDESFEAAPGIEVRLKITARLRSKIYHAIEDEVATINRSIYVPEGP